MTEDSYSENLEWLFRQLPMFSRVGAAAYKPGLDRSLALAEHFNNPHKKFKAIHVAGTNGKGSVSHLIASVLQAHGYKTALYTSPHLVDFRERMRINGRMIPKEEVMRFITQWRGQQDKYPDRPSFFELTMMMAFKWFADEDVDYAVIETGMGGRLDSTNIITPLLSVITNISWDHAQFLGDTLPKIAGEKAGIIKPGIPVVIGEADSEIEQVFLKKANETYSPLYPAYKEEADISGLVSVCPLKGDYQLKNINTARVALDVLKRCGVEMDEKDILEGFARVTDATGLRGRWTILDREPLTICDTGHNEAGIRYNMAQLRRLMSQRRNGVLRMVIGFVADKDLDHILPLFPGDARYYLTQAAIPRALKYTDLAEKAKNLGWEYGAYPDVASAYAKAKEDASPEDIIFVGGSTFIVADLLAL